MLHWQSAWRLLIATLVFAMPWPAFAQAADGTTAGDEVLAADAKPDAAKSKSKRRNKHDWSDWRNYTVSTGLGFGVTFDKADSTVEGSTKYENSQSNAPCFFESTPTVTSSNCEPNSDSVDGFFQGGSFYVDGRVELPAFDVASQPRIFASAVFIAQNQEEKPLAASGFPRSTWTEGRNYLGGSFDGVSAPPFLRVEQTLDPKSMLFVGVGGSFLLPVESYPIRLNASINYFRTKSTVGALYDWRSGFSTNSVEQTVVVKSEQIMQGIAPGAGFDIEVGRLDWLTLSFFGNALFGIPLTGTDWDSRLFNGFAGFLPDEGFTEFTYKRGFNMTYMVGIRFSFEED